MNLIMLQIILVACLILCSCNREKQGSHAQGAMPIKKADILSLQKGITRNQVETILGGPGRYQFSVRLKSGDYLCTSYTFEKPFVYFYFLFRSNVLEKTLSPPSFDVNLVPYKDFYREIKLPCNAEKRVDTVLQTNGLSPAELLDALRLQVTGNKETFDLLPALIVTAPLLEINAEARKAHYEKNALLAEQFDPAKAKLGDTESSLISIYGIPIMLETNGAVHVYRFNSDVPLNINPAHRFSGVSVTTENGMVTGIFCNDFYCGSCSAAGADPYDDPERPNYFCKVHGVYFDDPKSPHMNH